MSFVLIREGQILTREFDTVILHRVTREALLIVTQEMVQRVEQRVFGIDEMLAWVREGEAVIAGTAAVLSGVGTLVARGGEHLVGANREHVGQSGPLTAHLRATFAELQRGTVEDTRGGLHAVGQPQLRYRAFQLSITERNACTCAGVVPQHPPKMLTPASSA